MSDNRPERRKRHHRSVGSSRNLDSMVEIGAHRSDSGRARPSPIMNQARAREIKMVLHRNENAESIEAREMLLARQESVDDEIVRYLNRLGDALFVWSRWVSHTLGAPEILWEPNRAASGLRDNQD